MRTSMKDRRVIAAFASGALAALGVGVAVGAQSETAQTGGGRAAFAVLNGAKEIGNDGQKGAGDPNGRGSFTGILDGNKLCFGLTVANIGNPIAAHIHKGGRNANGDVVVPLKFPRKGDPGASHGCTEVEPSLAADFRSDPGDFYVNVHNEKFPSGAIRGQAFNGG
jgi:hypothetical protein